MEDGDPRILTEIDRTIAQRELAEQLAASRAEQILPEGAEDVAVEMDIVEPEDNGALDIGSLCRLVAEDWRRDRLEELNKVTVNKHKTWSDGVNEMNKAMKKENIKERYWKSIPRKERTPLPKCGVFSQGGHLT
jgi:hypothetical protein